MLDLFRRGVGAWVPEPTVEVFQLLIAEPGFVRIIQICGGGVQQAAWDAFNVFAGFRGDPAQKGGGSASISIAKAYHRLVR